MQAAREYKYDVYSVLEKLDPRSPTADVRNVTGEVVGFVW